MGIFDKAKPKEITYGTVVSMGARKLRIRLSGGQNEIHATCSPELIQKTKVGYSVVIAYLEGGAEAYVLSSSLSIMDAKEQAIITI